MRTKIPKHPHVWIDLPVVHPAWTVIYAICDELGVTLATGGRQATPEERQERAVYACTRSAVRNFGIDPRAALALHNDDACHCKKQVSA